MWNASDTRLKSFRQCHTRRLTDRSELRFLQLHPRGICLGHEMLLRPSRLQFAKLRAKRARCRRMGISHEQHSHMTGPSYLGRICPRLLGEALHAAFAADEPVRYPID